MDLGFDGCARVWHRPDSRRVFFDWPQETWTFTSSRPHVFAKGGISAEHHARIDGLNHIRGRQSNGNAQREVHENMRLDKGAQETVIGVEEDNIFPRTRLETLLRGKALTAIVLPPHYFRQLSL
jgi:hypothetical protein